MSNYSVTLIGVNFFPEDTAIGLYSTQLAEYLSDAGCAVTVVTGFPYYPQWKIRADYVDHNTWHESQYGAISVLRYKQYVPVKPSFIGRVASLLDFTLGSFINLFKIKKTDIVICVVPFTTSVLLGWLLARFKGAKLWVHVQDFEFDAAFDAGLLKPNRWYHPPIKWVLFGVERFLFNRADRVSTISMSMLKKLETKTTSSTFYFPNWVDLSGINPKQCAHHPYMESAKFKVLYSGNIGEKQDWEQFIALITHYKDNAEVEFVVVGEGAKKSWLQTRLKDYKHVRFYDPVPYNQLNHLLCNADLHILLQKNDVLDSVMPSKVLAMMASAKPSLISGHECSDVGKILLQAQGSGYVQSLTGCIAFIDELLAHPEKAIELGRNSRSYVQGAFSKSAVLLRYYEQMQQVMKEIP
jgi:colanic acid biosynthesis glycosyl transferase WcaI